MFQFNIVFGIVIAFLSNALLARIGGENAWRWMLGIAAFPSVIYAVMCFGIPESPRWLIGRKGDRAGGPEGAATDRARRLRRRSSKPTRMKSWPAPLREGVAGTRFWTWRLRVPILLAFLVAFFNQLSGINAVLYFAPRIFEMTGLGEKAALLQSVGIGVTNLIFTFVGLWLIDRLGRRTLLYIGSFGYIALAGADGLGVLHPALRHRAGLHLRLHCGARRRPGSGDLGVHFRDLPQPPSRRRPGAGQLHALDLRRPADHVLPQDGHRRFAPGYVFLFFCGMMVLQLVWVKTMVPETKGVPLEQMQKCLGVE